MHVNSFLNLGYSFVFNCPSATNINTTINCQINSLDTLNEIMLISVSFGDGYTQVFNASSSASTSINLNKTYTIPGVYLAKGRLVATGIDIISQVKGFYNFLLLKNKNFKIKNFI